MLEHFKDLLAFLALYKKRACLRETPPEPNEPICRLPLVLAAPVDIVNVVQSSPKVPK